MSHLYRHPPRTGNYWLAYMHSGKLYRESLKTKDRATAKYLQNKKDRELLESRDPIPKQARECLPLLQEYIEVNKHRRSQGASLNSEEKVKAFLAWAKIKTVNQISERRFLEYLNHRIGSEKLSPFTANHIIAIIKAWLNYAVQGRYIFSNPLAHVRRFPEPENEKRFFSVEEIALLLKESANPKHYVDGQPTLYPAIATGIYAGPRPAELFALDWEDFDFARKRIRIRNKPNFMVKTKRFREVPICSNLLKILEPLRKNKGRCFDGTNRRRILGRILEAAKLEGANFYTLRHTFISHALMNGVPIRTVMKWAGHRQISTTIGYSHLIPEHEDREIEKLNFEVI
jgi:integrase